MACDDENALVGTQVPNSTPDTEITSTPPNADRTGPFVSFFWRGTDHDGDIVGFEWRISDNGVDGVVDIADTLGLDWHFTTQVDTTFFVSADIDSFQADVDDPDLDGGQYRYWQTHTLFVRAVDDRGAVDPTPANVSFTATTIAPRVQIDVPRFPPSISCARAPRALTFGWTATDPDSDDHVPEAIRYLLFPVETRDNCYTQLQYETEQPIRADDPEWTDWIPYDPDDIETRLISYPRQDIGKRFLFAVQARDDAGAVTPLFEWAKNVQHVEIVPGQFPSLIVSSSVARPSTFAGGAIVSQVEVLANQPIDVSWTASGDSYGGVIEAYRFGWNISDLNDPRDPGWEVEWGNGAAWTASPTKRFQSGSPNLIVLARDNSGTVTRGIVQFQVIPEVERANQRNVLLIDDYPNGTGTSQQDLEVGWDMTWSGMLQSIQGFQPFDVIDAQSDANRLRFANVSQYKSVIWFTSPNEDTFFHSQIAPGGGRTAEDNWLEVYQERVGNILMCGPGAMQSTFEGPGLFGSWTFPVIFDVPAGGSLGFGQTILPDGRRTNTGRTRWPWSGWCLEAVDQIRPGIGNVFGETPQQLKRTLLCDTLNRAIVADEFLAEYPDAAGRVVELTPLPPRNELDGEFFPNFEEFYNVNVTNRSGQLVPRACQTPMYRLSARRDNGFIANPRVECRPTQRDTSPIDGVPIAMVSRLYSETKLLAGAEDFVWGFHPMSFEVEQVRSALVWIMQTRWELPSSF